MIERNESHPGRGATGTEGKVARSRIHKPRVNHYRTNIHRLLLPLLARHVRHAEVGLAVRPPIDVTIEGDITIVPVPRERLTRRPVHDIPLEREAPMRLRPRPLDLRVPAERDDVVAEDV